MTALNHDIDFRNALRCLSPCHLHLRSKCVSFLIFAFFTTGVSYSSDDISNLTVAKTLELCSDRSEYIEPTHAELLKFHELAISTLTGDQKFQQLRKRWEKLGWSLENVRIRDEIVWILSDSETPKRGAGAFAIRPNSSSQILVQAPHSYFDKFTRPITVRVFEQSDFRAAAWNTVHRRVIDVAHSRHSYFHEFTKAFLATAKKPLVVQIHGFAQASRTTISGAGADIIVSNGTRFPPPWLRVVSQELHSITPNVRLFPTQVNELGATSNAQALLSRQSGADFLHVELSQPVRRRFRRQSAVIDEFLKSILLGYRSL